MKHDLDAINAAMRLGDRPVPPLGSVCRVVVDVLGEEAVGRVMQGLTTTYLAKHVDGQDFRLIDLDPPDRSGDWRILEILQVPEDAPPYDQWKRQESNDLEVINAALLLGDKFVPPAGTIFRLDRRVLPHRLDKIFVQVQACSMVDLERALAVAIPGTWRCDEGFRRQDRGAVTSWEKWNVWHKSEVVYVPDEAPPFQEWERLWPIAWTP